MQGDITQDQWGWFYRDNGDGTHDSLSAETATPTNLVKVTRGDIPGHLVVLVRHNQLTGAGDPLAARLALQVLARRYTTTNS